MCTGFFCARHRVLQEWHPPVHNGDGRRQAIVWSRSMPYAGNTFPQAFFRLPQGLSGAYGFLEHASPMKMIRSPLAGALVLTLLCSLSLPAAAQQGGNLFGNIFKPPGAAEEAERVANENVEIVERLARLEHTLRQLTGQVETLQHRNQQLEAQVRILMESTGGRTAARATPPPVVAPVVPDAGGVPATASGRRSDAFDPKASPEAPGLPHPLGSTESASSGVISPAIGAVSPAEASGVTGATSARALYDAGAAALQKGQHEEAERSFRTVIADHSSDRLVPDATFMVGETLFLRQDFSEAAASFLEVTTKFPNSVRAPEALLRLGQSLAGLGEKETACATFMEVGRKYPRAPSSIRQAVEKEQQRVGC